MGWHAAVGDTKVARFSLFLFGSSACCVEGRDGAKIHLKMDMFSCLEEEWTKQAHNGRFIENNVQLAPPGCLLREEKLLICRVVTAPCYTRSRLAVFGSMHRWAYLPTFIFSGLNLSIL